MNKAQHVSINLSSISLFELF